MADSFIVIRSIVGAELYRSTQTTIKKAIIDAVMNGANLREADLYGANLRGANLREVDLRGADLYGADLYGANLRGANLREADLRGADLYEADLRRADLRGADNIIIGPQRSDGYLFFLVKNDKEWRLIAGCRNFTMNEAQDHWQATRARTALGDETFAILDYLKARLAQVEK